MITRDDVETAAARIAGRVRRTPVMTLPAGDVLPGRPDVSVAFKLEHLQHTGSFKARGMCNRVLAAADRGEIGAAGVVAASGGNAGLAVAWAAAAVGTTARIFVPETAPAFKVQRLHALGADVVQVGRVYGEAYAAAMADVERTGAVVCHAYDQPEVCAGQGTLALELEEQLPDGVDTVLVAVGGGGLLAGVAAALEGRAKVVGVEPSRIPTLHDALEAGHQVDVDVSGVAADSLGATRLGDVAWDVARRAEVGSVLVGDDEIVRARQELWDQWRLVVEHGAATAFAALRSAAYRPAPGERVCVVLCGANTSPADLVAQHAH